GGRPAARRGAGRALPARCRHPGRCAAGTRRIPAAGSPRWTGAGGSSRPWRVASWPLQEARADGRKPAHERRVLAQDRLVALGAGRDETERRPDQLLEPLEIAPRLRRQVGLVLRADGRPRPALDLLVDWLVLCDHVLPS